MGSKLGCLLLNLLLFLLFLHHEPVCFCEHHCQL
jgi:hypothetical protein